MLARYRWTDEDYSTARSAGGFPAPLGSGLGRDSLRWYLADAQAWESVIRRMAGTLPRS